MNKSDCDLFLFIKKNKKSFYANMLKNAKNKMKEGEFFQGSKARKIMYEDILAQQAIDFLRQEYEKNPKEFFSFEEIMEKAKISIQKSQLLSREEVESVRTKAKRGYRYKPQK